MTESFLFIPPMSPCRASPAFIKLDGEPVLERVADTFLAMCPDLPMPSVIIFPRVLKSASQTKLKSDDSVFASFSNPLDSILIVRLPDLR